MSKHTIILYYVYTVSYVYTISYVYRLMVHKRLSNLTSVVALVALRRHAEPIKAEVSEWLSLHLQVNSATIATKYYQYTFMYACMAV